MHAIFVLISKMNHFIDKRIFKDCVNCRVALDYALVVFGIVVLYCKVASVWEAK